LAKKVFWLTRGLAKTSQRRIDAVERNCRSERGIEVNTANQSFLHEQASHRAALVANEYHRTTGVPGISDAEQRQARSKKKHTEGAIRARLTAKTIRENRTSRASVSGEP
jgi:hypothetical protein